MHISLKRVVHPLVLTVAMGVAGVATAAGADLRKTADDVHARYGQMYKKKDTDGLRKLMGGITTPDFKLIQKGRPSLALSQWIAMEKGDLTHTKAINQFELKTMSAITSGTTGVIMDTLRVRMTMIDPEKKPHAMGVDGSYRENWVQRAGQWKLQRLELLSEKWTMDGKPYIPPPPIPTR